MYISKNDLKKISTNTRHGAYILPTREGKTFVTVVKKCLKQIKLLISNHMYAPFTKLPSYFCTMDPLILDIVQIKDQENLC